MTSFYGGGATSTSGGGGSSAKGALIFKGTLGIPDDGATVLALPDTHEEGWTYLVVTAGTYAGQLCEKGDFVICVSSGESASDLDWTVVQGNTFNTLPTPTALDEGKIISVDASGNYVLIDNPSSGGGTEILPDPSEADEGKILSVGANGNYTLIDNPIDNKLDKNNGIATGITTFDKAQANRLELLVNGESIGGFRSIDLTPAVTDNGDDSSMKFVPLFIGEPTKDAHAANKKYVDESVASVYPIEIAQGNPAVCENGAEYGLQGLKIYGKSTQGGTPSPENPVPIVSAGDSGSIAINVSKKQLLPLPQVETSFEVNGVSFIYNDGNFSAHGTATSDTWINLYPTVKSPTDNNDIGPEIFGNFLMVSSNSPFNGIHVRKKSDPNENFWIGLGGKYVQLTEPIVGAFVFIANGQSVDFDGTIGIFATNEDIPSEYIPYYSKSLTISTPNGLPGIPVDSGGNYTDANGQQWLCDVVDLETSKRIENVWNGTITEEMVQNGAKYGGYDAGDNAQEFYIKLDIPVLNDAEITVYGFCDKFLYSNQIIQYSVQLSNTGYLYVRYPRGTYRPVESGNNIAPFEPLIGAKLVVPCSPITTPLRDEELAAYRTLHTYDGTTTISTSEDVSGIEVQYLKKNRALPASSKQDAGRVVTVNDQGQFSLTDKYLDGVDLDSIFSLFIDGKNTTEMFWKWYPLTDKYSSTKYSRLERWCKLLANAWSNKTYTLRFYKASVSGDYTGTPLDDLADGRQAAPLVTDSSEPTEDWAENDPMTWYIRANALSLADGTMDILYFEGEDGFDITGEIAPVYCFALALYMKEWSDDQYLYKSWRTVYGDEYVPYKENVAPDSSFRNITWHPAFGGGLNASDGMTSGAGKKPMVWTSSNNALLLAREITQYEGLWTDCDQQYVLSQWQLRHWTLENSGKLEGCTTYNYQYFLAAGETDVKRLLVTPEQGANFIVGSNVCLGNRGENENADRNQSYNHDIFNCATITSIEDVSVAEISYKSLNIDIEEPITTTTEMFVSTIAWSSGTTEALQDHCDGCIGNLTNGKYPIRVAGIEMMNGAYNNGTEPLWQASIVEDHWHYEVYSCRDSEKQAGSRTGDYVKTGEFDLPNAAEYTWYYITKLNASTDEAIIPMAFGGSSSTYYRSAFYSSGDQGGLRPPWRSGDLHDDIAAGLACAHGNRAPSYSFWNAAPRLAGSGKKRGKPAS